MAAARKAEVAKTDGLKVYDVLHDITTRVDDETGEERTWAPGEVFDPSEINRPDEDVEKLVAQLLAGIDFHGPLIAEQAKSDEPADPPVDTPPADSEGN